MVSGIGDSGPNSKGGAKLTSVEKRRLDEAASCGDEGREASLSVSQRVREWFDNYSGFKLQDGKIQAEDVKRFEIHVFQGKTPTSRDLQALRRALKSKLDLNAENEIGLHNRRALCIPIEKRSTGVALARATHNPRPLGPSFKI